MIKFVLLEADGTIRYDDMSETKNEAIMELGMCGIKILEVFSFKECMKILNQGEKYIDKLKDGKSAKTQKKADYAKMLLDDLSYCTLFDDLSLEENSIIHYKVFNDPTVYKKRTCDFISHFDFNRSFQSYLENEKCKRSLKYIEDHYLDADDYHLIKDGMYNSLKKAFVGDIKNNWNEHCELFKTSEQWIPMIRITKVELAVID